MMASILRQFWFALSGMLWPRQCEACGRLLTHAEDILCTHCEVDMPLTSLAMESFGPLHQRLASPHVMVERVASMMWYVRDDRYAKLIHHAKYSSRPHILEVMGRRYGASLARLGFFDDIDLLIPVPMSRFKQFRRGYNQSAILAYGLCKGARQAGVKVALADNLKVKRAHSTQTRRGTFQRWLNVRDVYGAKRPQELVGKHVAIVDDVLTTGATTLACAEAIHAASPSTRISVVTLAATHLS